MLSGHAVAQAGEEVRNDESAGRTEAASIKLDRKPALQYEDRQPEICAL
jgi:hypothetical protein